MKYYRNFFSQLRIYVTTPMSCTSNLSVTWKRSLTFLSPWSITFFTNPRSVTWLILVFFFSYGQIYVKVFFHYFFTVLILFKNCFNKFISSVFTPKNSNRLTKSIISTNNFVSKTTRNMAMVFFWVRTFINFNPLQITLKITKNFKWTMYLSANNFWTQ